MSIEQLKNEANEKIKSQSNANMPESKNDLINALKQGFATTVNKIYINSLDKEIGFREITVQEQKTLSRIMIDNEAKNRKDVIYDAQCALINTACLEKENFNIYELTEFDRLKLLIAIYQANMFKNDIKFTCEECGAENVYKLDFDIVLHKLDEVKLETKTFEYENKNWKYLFDVEYPAVKRVLQFHKSYVNKYRGAKKQEVKSIDNVSNMDYINLFIKNIEMTNKQTSEVKNIHLNDFNAGDVEDIISVFPQDVLYSEDGILKFIVNEYVKKINDTFEIQTCYNCGAKHENTVSSAESFL